MSRSNPTDNQPNPSTRWYEWDGTNGAVRHYDKTAKENIVSKLPFTFIVLDETATVKGWHDASDSGIFANEVRDTRADVLVVKSFKGGILAEGFYSNIRDRVAAHGGHFTQNIYIGYKDAQGALQIGSLQFKGAALNSWVEFKKAHRADLYKKAVKITGFVEGKKGTIKFRTPVFAIQDIGEKTNTEAVTLDTLLQHYLKGYFSRTRSQQVESPAHVPPPAGDDSNPEPEPPEQDADEMPPDEAF